MQSETACAADPKRMREYLEHPAQRPGDWQRFLFVPEFLGSPYRQDRRARQSKERLIDSEYRLAGLASGEGHLGQSTRPATHGLTRKPDQRRQSEDF